MSFRINVFGRNEIRMFRFRENLIFKTQFGQNKPDTEKNLKKISTDRSWSYQCERICMQILSMKCKQNFVIKVKTYSLLLQ